MTTTEPTETSPQDELLPEERDVEPFYFNRGMLLELGSCGEYVRKHRELFPPAEYPDGPVINSVTCRRFADDFDWNWAIDRMLEWSGRNEVERVAESRAQRYKALGPGRGNVRRYAAAFGFVFATRPDLRKPIMRDLAQRAEENAERRAREELREAEEGLKHAEAMILEWTRDRDQLREQLPALREAVEQVKTRAAERAATRKERELADAKRRVAQLEREAAELRERAQAVAAETAAETVKTVKTTVTVTEDGSTVVVTEEDLP